MILAGAAQVFAEQGTRSVPVEALLTAAGVSRRTFYRFYKGKEPVMEALYVLGIDALLSASRYRTRGAEGPIQAFGRCVDAYLGNAKAMGRLVYVLGGEAQNQESSLYAHRIGALDALVAILVESTREQGIDADPWVFRSLFLALESMTRATLQAADEGRAVTTEAVERTRRVLMRLGTAAIAGAGPGVTPLPRDPELAKDA